MTSDRGASAAIWPGRYFLNGCEVDEATAHAAESEGASVAQAGSGDTPAALGGGTGPWMELTYPAGSPCTSRSGDYGTSS